MSRTYRSYQPRKLNREKQIREFYTARKKRLMSEHPYYFRYHRA